MGKLIDTDCLEQVIDSGVITFAKISHTHAASNISSGTLAAARLPKATSSALGAVKVGSGLAISSDGTLSLDVASASGVNF